MTGLREFLNKPAGKAVGIGVVLVGLAVAGWSIWSTTTPDNDLADARKPWFVDGDTGKPFRHELVSGETFPVVAPSGKNTGYPAELCYWTKDGKPKNDPTPVLLNSYIGKSGPTFCPDCGRLVVAHNPPATDNGKPPPTLAEYTARHSVQTADVRSGR